MTYLSVLIVPIIITSVILVGLLEKKNVYNLFCEGAKDGIKITVGMFPTLIGIFLAIGMLRSSGTLDYIVKIFSFLTKFEVPGEILPLALIKPISGSAAMALATDLMTKFGTESKIGMMSACIMGASETTFYVIAIYMNEIKAKESRNVIIPAILADIASIVTAILILK